MIILSLKDLNHTIIILISISLNILGLMILSNLIKSFINPFLLLGVGFTLFLIIILKYFNR